MAHSFVYSLEIHQLHQEAQLSHEKVHSLNDFLRLSLANFLDQDDIISTLWEQAVPVAFPLLLYIFC